MKTVVKVYDYVDVSSTKMFEKRKCGYKSLGDRVANGIAALTATLYRMKLF